MDTHSCKGCVEYSLFLIPYGPARRRSRTVNPKAPKGGEVRILGTEPKVKSIQRHKGINTHVQIARKSRDCNLHPFSKI